MRHLNLLNKYSRIIFYIFSKNLSSQLYLLLILNFYLSTIKKGFIISEYHQIWARVVAINKSEIFIAKLIRCGIFYTLRTHFSLVKPILLLFSFLYLYYLTFLNLCVNYFFFVIFCFCFLLDFFFQNFCVTELLHSFRLLSVNNTLSGHKFRVHLAMKGN